MVICGCRGLWFVTVMVVAVLICRRQARHSIGLYKAALYPKHTEHITGVSSRNLNPNTKTNETLILILILPIDVFSHTPTHHIATSLTDSAYCSRVPIQNRKITKLLNLQLLD